MFDEFAANLLLHGFLRYRHRPAARGPSPQAAPELYSGDLAAFYGGAKQQPGGEPRRVAARERGLHVITDWCFASPAPLGWPESDTAWFRHWKPLGGDAGLTIVGVDGIVQLGTAWFQRLADALATSGVDVLAMDAPFNFRRTPKGYRPGQLILGGDLGHVLAVTRQAVRDLWWLVEWARRDGRRVGLVGVSYGGWLALLASLVVPGVDLLVSVAPPVDIVGLLQTPSTVARALRRGLGCAKLDHAELRRIVLPVTPLAWPRPLPGRQMALHAARYDRFVPPEAIERLARKWQTDLTLHALGHFQLAVTTNFAFLIARQVLESARHGSGQNGASASTIQTCGAGQYQAAP